MSQENKCIYLAPVDDAIKQLIVSRRDGRINYAEFGTAVRHTVEGAAIDQCLDCQLLTHCTMHGWIDLAIEVSENQQ